MTKGSISESSLNLSLKSDSRHRHKRKKGRSTLTALFFLQNLLYSIFGHTNNLMNFLAFIALTMLVIGFILCDPKRSISLKQLKASRLRLEKAKRRVRLTEKFLAYLKHYRAAKGKKEICVYYFLCNILELPDPKRELEMRKVVKMLDADRDSAEAQMTSRIRRSFNSPPVDLSLCSN